MQQSYVEGFFSTGAVATVILAAAALALPATLFALWLYRRSVAAAMRRPSGRPQAMAALEPPAPGPRPPLAHRHVDARASEPAAPAAAALAGEVERRLRATLAVYAVAGLAYAIYQGVIALLADGLELLPVRTTFMVWGHFWPVLVAANLITAPGARAQFLAVAGYFALPLGLAPSMPLAGPTYWAIAMGPPTVLLAVFLHPRLRAAGPLVLAFMLVAVLGAHLAGAAAATAEGMAWIVNTAVLFELGSVELLLYLAVGAFALFGALGWLLLEWIRRRYEAKRISDQTLALDAVWLVFTVLAAEMLLNQSVGWALAGLAGFLGYKLAAIAGFAVLRSGRRSGEPNRRLLVLRVFGSRERSERLFARAGARWRHVGSIQLIAGTDLATANLEPHEFLDFLRGKLGDRYIGDADALARQLAAMDLGPDADGRYRVNEFFCRDDTWKATLERLAQSNDVVLMDLRGFSRDNRGCIFELNALAAAVPLERVLLVVDATTDEPLLRRVLDEAWAALPAGSPNLHRADPAVTLLRIGRDDPAAARAIVAALARAAAPAGAAQPSSKAFAISS